MGAYGDLCCGRRRLVVVEMVHDQILIVFSYKMIGHRHRVAMVIAHGKGILPQSAEPFHRMLHTILDGVDLPPRVGVEDVGHDHAFVARQAPVGGIRLTVEVRVGAEECHLRHAVPQSAFIIIGVDRRTLEAIDIVSVGRAADVDVRLPDVSAGCRMAVLQQMTTVVVHLMVQCEVGVTAEELVSTFERAEQREYLGAA